MDLTKLSEQEKIELAKHLEQRETEKVSPKMERFREPWRIKIAHGGRGAGAKSWSAASLLVQRAHRESLRICCFREIQKSLEESSYRLMVDTIYRLWYSGWKITREALDAPSGSHIIFRGLADMRAADQMKSLEGYDIFWLEEASAISRESISVLLPTLRKLGSELWATLNREAEKDPIIAELWDADRNDVLRIELEPGKKDNPWFPDVLQQEMETAYKNNSDEAIHVWGGQPRTQGDNAVLSRVAIRAAMSRTVEAVGGIQIGADIARFGDDRTQLYRRQGYTVTGQKTIIKQDTMTVASEIWDFAERSREAAILVDTTGIGSGVFDRLRQLGANAVEINFGSSPKNQNKYTSLADEMWFSFRDNIAEYDIPDDRELMEELSGRLFSYTTDNRYKIERKDEFKKRYGRSPDKADALLMCFFTGYKRGSSVGSAKLLGI
jgi:phage terminase large subunit